MSSGAACNRSQRSSVDSRTKSGDSSFKLAPLLAPKHANADRLPSIKELDLSAELLASARGVVKPPPTGRVTREALGIDGQPLQEYKLKHGKRLASFIMQTPAHERGVTTTRETIGGRTITYRLEVAQDPKQARACGNGIKSSSDRRPVDPPPVVKMNILHNNVDITGSYDADFILFATLEHARPIANGSIYSASYCPVLAGNTCVGASYLQRPAFAAYFIFSDLAVRHEGFYRLKFTLMECPKNELDREIPRVGTEDMRNDSMRMRTYVYSPPFQVYSAKKFPGLEQSTELSALLNEQGCRVRVRREVRQRRPHAGKGGNKEEEHRNIKAADHNRAPSVDSQSWNRPVAPQPSDSRRPSMDSQYTQSWRPSRQQSIAQSSILSPSSAKTDQQRLLQPGHTSQPSTPPATEPENFWSSQQSAYNPPPQHNAYSAPIQQSTYNAPSQSPFSHDSSDAQRPSIGYPPYQPIPGPSQSRSTHAPTPSYNLPPVMAMIQPQAPARPEPGSYDGRVAPKTGKRSLGRSSDDYVAMKDRARPLLQPSSSFYSGYAGYSSGRPIVGGNDIIEASQDDDDASSDVSDDPLDLSSYRRANGSKTAVPLEEGLYHARGL